ncbi:hypothetical protein ESMG_00272, partial [Escherichia coli M919]
MNIFLLYGVISLLFNNNPLRINSSCSAVS